MTDASDYGIGGYLYQTVDGVKQLIALVSKSLTETQLKWSVIQKEAYAIYYCCNYLDAILRDRKFTIMTDHKNLTYLNQASNPMVVRWNVALQELDFDLLYVPGDQNTIADAMSRLCLNNKPPKSPSEILAAIHGPYEILPEHYEQITLCHNAQLGHGGVERTLRKLKELKLNWPTMRLDVKTYIRECPCCQKMSQIKVPITAYKYATSTYRPMECLNIDFLGPYPDKGYVLTMVDTFTRWVELYAVPEATSEQAALCLLQHFGRFGSPSVIRSDRGPHFANALIAQFLRATGTAQNLTLAYSSQENAIVERNNKEINRHLRALTFNTNTVDDYQLLLPFVQRIMNSSHNERTKIAPAQLLFGNAINLDRGILLPFEEQPQLTQSLADQTSKLLQAQQTLFTLARTVLSDSDAEHVSQNTSVTEFTPDSYVLVAQRSAPETRLHTLWRGPMRVISSDRGAYTLLDLTTNKEKQYHVTQLKQFLFSPSRTDPLDVARKDYLEFFVEAVLSHTGLSDRISTLKFHIKWLGYDESHNSWEPWSNLRDMEILHRYLIQKNLRRLIPLKFQGNYRD
jgi:transposase InsO family protein